jgi:hypothetical protein
MIESRIPNVKGKFDDDDEEDTDDDDDDEAKTTAGPVDISNAITMVLMNIL